MPSQKLSDCCQRLAGPDEVRVRFGINAWPPPVRTVPGTRGAVDQQSGGRIRYWHRRQGVSRVGGEGGPCGSEPRTIQGGDVPHDRADLTGCFLEELLHRWGCLLYTSPSPRDGLLSRMPSSA